jgi:hypothetical protein
VTAATRTEDRPATVEAPPPWLMGPGKAAHRTRVAIIVGSNVAFVALAWVVNPPH